jgi:hypothetical protein
MAWMSTTSSGSVRFMVGVESRQVRVDVRSLGRVLRRGAPLLVAGTISCLEPSGTQEPFVQVPPPANAAERGPTVHVVPAEPPTVEQLRAQFPGLERVTPPCQEPFLSDGPYPGDVVVLNAATPSALLHVDAAATDVADGSAERPFPTIEQALARASSGTRVLVAPGQYRQELTIPPGVRLTGLPAREGAQAGARPVLTAHGLTFAASAGPDQISTLEHFEVHASITLRSGARVVLDDNVLSPTLSEFGVAGTDTHTGIAVSGVDAALRAQHNTLFVASPNPANVYSRGFHLTNSCAVLSDNYLADFRTPFELRSESDAAIQFNVIDQGANGFFIQDSIAVLHGNYARLTHAGGCVYAVYSDGSSQPAVSYNQFYLQTWNTKGFNEANANSDPASFVGNAFRTRSSDIFVYLNRETIDTTQQIYDIAQVNALGDIPVRGGNSLSVDSK